MRYALSPRAGQICFTALAVVLGCNSSDAVNAPPALLVGSTPQVATVGLSFSYDATLGGSAFSDPRQRGLRYSVTLTPAGSGLTTDGGQISGTPIQPGILTARAAAIDFRGDTAISTFPIVIFAAGLTAPVLPASVAAYSDARVPLPAYFSASGTGSALAADNMPAANPTTDHGATLGRVLFYDTRLSVNDQVACASCHHQDLGFGDTARFSRGVGGALTARHAMGLANARFYLGGRAFWDERAGSFEAQALQPILNPTELGLTLGQLVLKLEVTSYYPPLFEAAFGTPDITSDRAARAIAQFVRSLVSSNSRADSVLAGTATFTAQELLGSQVFDVKGGCAQCHRTNAGIADSVRNIGLETTNLDLGAGGGRMKAPSLRNIAVRPPYMHDGHFGTLEQVIQFYDSGVQANPMLDPRLKAMDNTPKRLNLTVPEREALAAYLRTLTDQVFLHDPRFSDPFPP